MSCAWTASALAYKHPTRDSIWSCLTPTIVSTVASNLLFLITHYSQHQILVLRVCRVGHSRLGFRLPSPPSPSHCRHHLHLAHHQHLAPSPSTRNDDFLCAARLSRRTFKIRNLQAPTAPNLRPQNFIEMSNLSSAASNVPTVVAPSSQCVFAAFNPVIIV